MDITVNHFKRCVVVKFDGILDGSNANELEAVLNPIVDSGMHNLVLDLTDVELLSSKGLRLLVQMHQKCSQFPAGKVVLAGVSPRIQKSLRLVAMDKYFATFDQVMDAVGSF